MKESALTSSESWKPSRGVETGLAGRGSVRRACCRARALVSFGYTVLEADGPVLALVRPTTRVHYMSGHTTDVILRKGVLDGTVAYLSKPFTPNELAARIRHVLEAVQS